MESKAIGIEIERGANYLALPSPPVGAAAPPVADVAAWPEVMPPTAVPPSAGPLFVEAASTLSPDAAGLMPAGYSLEGGPPDAAVGPSADAIEDLGAGGLDGFLSHALKATSVTQQTVVAKIFKG
ncbi:hypothetical protein BH11PSE13_BH11PSE13_23980 [soil metagenome]